ncbi:MAG: YdcF family protein [Alphaproteobacteria bacterium]|nr:YdcF family protein [Alphaproteobacteria bacterium]
MRALASSAPASSAARFGGTGRAASKRPERLRRRRSLLIGPMLLLLAAAGLLPLALAPALLSARDPLASAQAIVVLGGDLRDRAPLAAALSREGLAPTVLVSGAGDCDRVRQALERLGVPAERVWLECHSRTTRENAWFAGEMLRERGLHRIILVTSWQHSARAKRSFARLAPDLDIASYPTRPLPAWLPVASPAEAAAVYEEYVKYGWYCLAYGICPGV